jgi:hypothetical protein
VRIDVLGWINRCVTLRRVMVVFCKSLDGRRPANLHTALVMGNGIGTMDGCNGPLHGNAVPLCLKD